MTQKISSIVLGAALMIGLLASAGSAQAEVQDIRVPMKGMTCEVRDAHAAPIQVAYDGASQILVVTSKDVTTHYKVFRLIPGLANMILLNGYSDAAGYVQMNIVPNGTSMIFQRGLGQVNYVKCLVNL